MFHGQLSKIFNSLENGWFKKSRYVKCIMDQQALLIMQCYCIY